MVAINLVAIKKKKSKTNPAAKVRLVASKGQQCLKAIRRPFMCQKVRECCWVHLCAVVVIER